MPAPKKLTLDELKAAIADFDPKEVKALLKQNSRKSGPTLLSVTMDAIVAAGFDADTKDIVASVTERGRTAGLLAAGASAKQTNVAVLKRYAQAFCEAQERAKAAG